MRFLSLAWVASSLLTLGASEIESLDRQLFFDKRLSADGTLNCGMCHRPDTAFADPNPVSTGIGGAKGNFNAPSVLKLQHAKLFLWNGRSTSLEQQTQGPLLNPIEMGNNKEDLEDRLSRIPEYQLRFRCSFGDSHITLDRITNAIRSLTIGASVVANTGRPNTNSAASFSSAQPTAPSATPATTSPIRN